MSFPHLNLAATANTSWLTDPLPLPGGEGVLQISSDMDDQMGTKIETQKHP